MEKPILLKESGYTAYLKTSVTYGDHQRMQASLMSAAKGNVNPSTQEYVAEFDASATIEWNYTKLLTMVTKLVKDDKEISVTRKLNDNIPATDGILYEKKTDKIKKKKKKKQDETPAE